MRRALRGEEKANRFDRRVGDERGDGGGYGVKFYHQVGTRRVGEGRDRGGEGWGEEARQPKETLSPHSRLARRGRIQGAASR